MSIPTTQSTHQALIRYPGEPSLSDLSNVMIQSIQGNSDLLKAQVIGIGDYHSDLHQKFIRAQIINEIIRAKGPSHKIHFLIEGVEAIPIEGKRIKRFHELYELMVGRDLIHSRHSVSGWDNDIVIEHEYEILKKVQQLWEKHTRLKQFATSLRQEITEDTRSKEEKIKTEQKVLSADDTVLDDLEEAMEQTMAIGHLRNSFLHQSIRDITKQYPKSIIFVLAGQKHFESISQSISDISHCILTTRITPSPLRGIHLLNSLYGKA